MKELRALSKEAHLGSSFFLKVSVCVLLRLEEGKYRND